MHRFLFVTHSYNKLSEAERFLDMKLQHYGLDLPELQSVDVEEVAVHKVKYAYSVLHRPVMVDDTGLWIDAWNGLPGGLVKWFMQRVGDRGICDMMQAATVRTARAKTVVATIDDEVNLNIYVGTMEGTIAPEPSGDGGYSWETIFIPNGSDRTVAQMTREEKDHYSMRRVAFEALIRREESMVPSVGALLER
ncbi:MAG: non-canonical purine NTP pyrophosphatase [Cyanobacteria bacterium J06638_22]